MARDTTTVEITTATWRSLNARKEPGESFNDVIARLLDRTAEPTQQNT